MNDGERELRNARLLAWMAGCARGDAGALAELYDTLSPQLFGLLLRILRRRDLAEEALQETFVNIWRKASEYRASRGSVVTWVTTIARHRAFDMLRRERREVAVEPDELIAASDAAAVDAGREGAPVARSRAEYRRLRDCLARLSEGQRASIAFAYFQGLTQDQIAARMGAPLGTVKSWVRRGLAGLKRCLET